MLEKLILNQKEAIKGIVFSDSDYFSKLLDFHSANKYFTFLFDTKSKIELGRIVGIGRKNFLERDLLHYKYIFINMVDEGIKVNQMENALTHIYGYFKNIATDEEKNEYFELIKGFNEREIAFKEVLKYLKTLSEKYDVNYIREQSLVKHIDLIDE